MTYTKTITTILVILIIIAGSGLGAAHDLELDTSTGYTEGWNNSTALDPYDEHEDGGLITVDDGRLHMVGDDIAQEHPNVTLNQSDWRITPVSSSSNITGESDVQLDTDHTTGRGDLVFVFENETGSEIRILMRHETADSLSRSDQGYNIEGDGVVQKVTRKDARMEASDTTSVRENWSFYVDLDKLEVGLTVDESASVLSNKVLTAEIEPAWAADTDTINFRYRVVHNSGFSPSGTKGWYDYLNLSGVNVGKGSTVSGNVTDINDNPIDGATVTTSTGEEVTTGADGAYSFVFFNGTYELTGSKSGYVDNTTKVVVAGENVTRDIILESERELRLDVKPYMDHGTTQPYEVWEVHENRSDVDVTSNASVTSANTNAIVVNSSGHLLEATGDLSVNERVPITATYNNSTVTENVTVSNLTVQNIDILPPWRRISALIGDVDDVGGTQKTYLWLIITMMAATTATIYSSSFGGLSTGVVFLVIGWAPGWVSTGTLLIGVFVGMFIGFNLAANIDYQVMR